MSQRFEGKNLEEALGHATAALAVERHQLTYHVLLEKRGFLGGVKRVVIEADVNPNAAPPAAAPAPAPAAEPVAAAAAPIADVRPPAPPSRGRSGGGAGAGGGGGRRGGRGRGRGDRDDRGGNERGRGGRGRQGGGGGGRGRGGSDLQVGDFERFAAEVPVDAPEQGTESEQAKVVRDWCEDALRLARLDVVVRTEENETQVHVKLYGRDALRFVDHNGELLDALQVLANKALVGRKVEKEIELDCQQFKERRIEEIGEQARATAEKVRRDGREQLLPAMSPIERRIVHLALQDDADVTTESRGDGFFKRVAIVRRSAAAETEPAAEQTAE